MCGLVLGVLYVEGVLVIGGGDGVGLFDECEDEFWGVGVCCV